MMNNSPIRITVIARPFDPEAFAEVLVEAARAELAAADPDVSETEEDDE
jgi:hypothetical protein